MFEVERQESGTHDIYLLHRWYDEKMMQNQSSYRRSWDSTKPVMIDDYNLCMGGVDKSNQLMQC